MKRAYLQKLGGDPMVFSVAYNYPINMIMYLGKGDKVFSEGGSPYVAEDSGYYEVTFLNNGVAALMLINPQILGRGL